jgi:hypothetical protein
MMKAILFLLLALEAASASACANYQYCNCLNADGTQNDTATQTIATIIERHIRFPALAVDISSVQATTTCRYDLTTAGGGRSAGILVQEDQILVAGANLAKIGVQGCKFLHDALHSDPHSDFDGVL